MAIPPDLSGFVKYFKSVLPAFYRRPLGLAWHEAQAIMHDVFSDLAREAVKTRSLERCPDDALPLHASDRTLEKRPGESLPQWRNRLLNAWDEWQWGGTKKGVKDNLVGMGYPGTAVYEYWDWQDGNDAQWARFWVVLNQPHNIQEPPLIGDGIEVGDGTVVGIGGIDEDEFFRIIRTVRTWQSGQSHFEELIAVTSGHLIGEDGFVVSDTGYDVAEGGAIYINVDRSDPR